MADIEVQDISELSDDKVQQSLAFLAELTQEEYPELDVRSGVVRDRLLLPSAQHAAANQENLDRYRRSSTLQGIAEDPTLADDDQVDAVLSNKGITRQAGQEASGEVTIVVSELIPITIATGTIFTGGGQQYTTTDAYTAKTSSTNVTAETDRVLQLLADGNYSFTVPVVASAAGSAGVIARNTLMETDSAISNLVKIFATSDFVGGTNTETNAQLLLREAEGIAAKALCDRINLAAFLRSQEEFADFVAMSVIGLGDSEMRRDQHSLWPGSFGGRADLYIRTADLPQEITLTKTATLISKQNDNTGIWQFSITRDDAPGYYDIISIHPDDSDEHVGGYPVTQELRNLDLTTIRGELLPDLDAAEEGTYSRYQSVVTQFHDTDTDATALTVSSSTKSYQVVVRVMPQIADLQALLGSRDVRNYMGDLLVKAPVPCFVTLSFTLLGAPGAARPDAYAIQSALAEKVNRSNFTGQLYASSLADTIYNFLDGNVRVSAITMLGRILRPDGTVKHLQSTEVLVVPYEPATMVSARTVGFILRPEDVIISAATLSTPEIL